MIDKNMEEAKPILEPKQSTIEKILSYSKSVNALQLNLFKEKFIVHLN